MTKKKGVQEKRGGEGEYCNSKGKNEGEGSGVSEQGVHLMVEEGRGEGLWFEKYLGKYYKGNLGKMMKILGKGGMWIN